MIYFTTLFFFSCRTHTPEECEAKYERVLISSLYGYALYLEKLPTDLLESVSVKNIALIENPKFWNLHKHKVPAIRAGWFKVISAILEFAIVFVGACKPEQQKHFVTHIFQYLDETEPTVIPHIWASVILIQQNIVDWHQHLNMDKAVMPKLWKVLKSGGSGMASIIFPNLLPLISKFDKTILGDKLLKFQLLFFENMNLGLREVQASRAEITAIATAYYECLQYVVIKIQNEDADLMAYEEKMRISCKLLDDHLIAVIYWCMNAETTSGKYIFGPLTNLLNFW
jgi:E3 ubiquitin-protein ligase listerin